MTVRQVSHYRVGAALGGGAMGRVYKAEDTMLGRQVALKFLPADLASDPRAIDRFLREARMMAGLDHRHICTVHEIGQADDDSWFIAMGWCNGATLKQRLAHGPLTPDLAVDYARQAALGLACAHDHGIVHRDIKPANLIVTGDDEIKILDFGIARLLGSTRHTAQGALVGTFGYLSPEQTRGEDVTSAADLWALGVVLYEMLTGRLPFSGEDHGAQLYAIAHGEPATLPMDEDSLLPAAARVIGRCLRKDPTERYGSAHELAAELAEIRGITQPPVTRTASTASAPPPRRSRRWPLVAALVVVLLAAVGFTSRWWLGAGAGDNIGVAVLPFSFVGDVDDDANLGQGLAWCLTNQLADLQSGSDAFWVASPGDVNRYTVRFHDEAKTKLGADRVVTGTGRVVGSNINLRLAVFDSRTGQRTEKEFEDATANLRTWQQDLATWVYGALDPDADPAALAIPAKGCTSVPSAFLAYASGMGALQAYRLANDDSTSLNPALVHLSRAVAADSSFARARAEYGYTLWREHKKDDPELARAGLAHLQRAVRLDSTMAWGHWYLGQVRAGAGDWQGALAAYEEGLEVDPDHAYLLEEAAETLDNLGRSGEAVRIYELLAALRPGFVPGAIYLAYHHIKAGNFGAAEPILRRLIADAPGNHIAYNYLGTAIFYGRGDPEAEDLFRQSLAIEPSFGCYNNLGTFYYYNHRYEDAMVAYQNSLELEPDQYAVWQNLAEASRWSPGYEDSARVAYAHAVAMGEGRILERPHDRALLADVASYHAFLGNRERALELLQQSAAAGEATGDLAVTVAASYEDLGSRDDAMVYLEQALETGVPLVMIEEYPGFRNLRSDARYHALIQRYR